MKNYLIAYNVIDEKNAREHTVQAESAEEAKVKARIELFKVHNALVNITDAIKVNAVLENPIADTGKKSSLGDLNLMPTGPLVFKIGSIELIVGDITKVPADAIVNAANKELRAGAGVCGAIYKAAGLTELDHVTKQLGPISTGTAVATPSFNLATGESKAKHIFHTVGPVYDDGLNGEHILLEAAYKSVYKLARQMNHDLERTGGTDKEYSDLAWIRSISFPCISTGVYGYPPITAARIAVETAIDFHKFNFGYRTKFVCFLESDFHIYKAFLEAMCK